MKAAAVVRTALQGQQRHTNTARRINNSSYGRYSSNLLSNFHPTVLSKCDDEEKRRHDDTVAATALHSRGFCQSLLPQLLSTRLLSHHNHDSHSNFSSLSTRRQFHTTPTPERYAAIVMTLGAIAATAKAGQYAVQGYNEWKEAAAAQQQQQEMEERGKMEQQGKEGKEDTTFTAEGGNTSGASFSDSRTGDDAQSKGEEKTTEGRRENIFASFFDMAIGSKYYEGGFEEKMTRKEAALILGVRESSTPKRIKEAHRKLLMLNHPDTGGSTFIAGKVNEAKELLLKGRKH